MESLNTVAELTFSVALICLGLAAFHVIKGKIYDYGYIDDEYLVRCLKCSGISFGVTVLILLINSSVPDNSEVAASFRNSIDEKISTVDTNADKISDWQDSKIPAEQKISPVNIPDDKKFFDWQDDTGDDPPDLEENKAAVKKYLEHVQPFAEIYSRRKAVGVKVPMATSDVNKLGAYALQMKYLARSVDNYFDSQNDSRMSKVHQACRSYILAEAKIAGWYVDLKRGDESLSDAVDAFSAVTNTGENLDAYSQQADAENEINRLAEWSGAEISSP